MLIDIPMIWFWYVIDIIFQFAWFLIHPLIQLDLFGSDFSGVFPLWLLIFLIVFYFLLLLFLWLFLLDVILPRFHLFLGGSKRPPPFLVIHINLTFHSSFDAIPAIGKLFVAFVMQLCTSLIFLVIVWGGD
mgnify:CR=1 FL=1